MPRTLVKTTSPGWYIDADDPDGKRVRKRGDDTIITRAFFELNGGAKPDPAPEQRDVAVADTGKLLLGKTTTVACRWVDEEHQTPAVQKLYSKDQRKVTLQDVEQAAGVVPCGIERTIKVQDAFQAKFCVQHQNENRKAIRRNKARAKRAAKS